MLSGLTVSASMIVLSRVLRRSAAS
jgi:hypothetical protein